jgi:hypothetical protein
MYLTDNGRPHNPRRLFPQQPAGGAAISRKSVGKAFFRVIDKLHIIEPFPKRAERQFWESCLRFRVKKRSKARFFESFSQN